MNVNVGTTERIIRAVIGLILLSLVFIGPHTWWGLIGLVLLATAGRHLLGVNNLRQITIA